MLLPLDLPSSNSSVRKRISVTRHCMGIVQSSILPQDSPTSDYIVPNSGATLRMRKNVSDFEMDSCVLCDDVFVLLGDNSEISVLDYGTSCRKIDGHTIRLINSLHVPELNCDLFSCTWHS